MNKQQATTILRLIFIQLLNVVQHANAGVIDDVKQICPYNNLCTVSGRTLNSTASDNLGPCCMDCYCDDECWKYNDCCIDVPHSRQASQPQTQCRYALVKNPAYYQLSERTLSKQFPSYRMIDSCPSSFTGSQLTKDKCMEAFTGVPNYDDVVMVSNKDRHDEIYKNKHCASCNGVQDIIKWNLFASFCAEDINDDPRVTASVAAKRIWNICNFYSTPAKALQFSRPLIDCGTKYLLVTCQVSDKTVDTQLKHLCEEGSYAPVYLVHFFKTLVYKNPFCLLCNNVVDIYKDVCDANLLDHRQRGENSRTLTMLLDGSTPYYDEITHSRLRTEQGNGCNEAEIFDYAMNQCRNLYCPANFAVFFGRCLKLSTTVSNVLLNIKFLFRPVTLTYTAWKVDALAEKEQNAFVSSFFKLLKLEYCQIKTMIVHVYTQPHNETICFVTIDIGVVLSNECPLDYITRNSRHLATKSVHIDIPINQHRTQLIGHLNFAEPFDESNQVLDFLNVYDRTLLIYWNRPMPTEFFLDQVFICPSIIINITEYNTLMMQLGQQNSTLSEVKQTTLVRPGFFVMANQTIAVCTDVYFDIFENSVSSGHRCIRFNCYMIGAFMLIFHMAIQKFVTLSKFSSK